MVCRYVHQEKIDPDSMKKLTQNLSKLCYVISSLITDVAVGLNPKSKDTSQRLPRVEALRRCLQVTSGRVISSSPTVISQQHQGSSTVTEDSCYGYIQLTRKYLVSSTLARYKQLLLIKMNIMGIIRNTWVKN